MHFKNKNFHFGMQNVMCQIFNMLHCFFDIIVNNRQLSTIHLIFLYILHNVCFNKKSYFEVTVHMEIPIEKILEHLESVENKLDLLLSRKTIKETSFMSPLLTIDRLAEYLFHMTGKKPAKATIYGWIHKKTIPYIKRDHSVLFEREKIDAWMISGRSSSYNEIIAQADLRMVAANRKRKKSIMGYH